MRVCSAYTTFVATDLKGAIPPPPAHAAQEGSGDTVAAPPHNAPKLLSTFKLKRRLGDITDAHTLHSLLPPTTTTRHPLLDRLEQATTERHASSVPIGATRITVRKQFLPRHLNYAGVVFGGDILTTLDRVAVACASRLTHVPMATSRILSLTFKQPVQLRQALHVTACVVTSWRGQALAEDQDQDRDRGGDGDGSHVSSAAAVVVVRTFVDDRHDGSAMKAGHAGVFLLTSLPSSGKSTVCTDAQSKQGHDNGMVVEAVPSPNDGDGKDATDFYAAMAMLQDIDPNHLLEL